MEKIIKGDPNYFYDMLPYAYALKVSDKWLEKFDILTLKEPEWRSYANAYEATSFPSFYESVMKAALKVMTSRPYAK